MTIRRITVSVAEEVARRIRKAAGNRVVSAWLSEVIEGHLDDAELERQWLEFYREVAPRWQELRRADAMFKRLTRPRRRGAA